MLVALERIEKIAEKPTRFSFGKQLGVMTGDKMGVVVVDIERRYLYRLRGKLCLYDNH